MRIAESVIGWLAPPACISCGSEGSSLCRVCRQTDLLPFGPKCWHCGRSEKNAAACRAARRKGSPGHVWVVTDYEDIAQALVKAYKFGHCRSAADPMSDAMQSTFREYHSRSDIASSDFLVVPVPTATSRIRQRGFDHAWLLARHVAGALDLQTAKVMGRFGQARQVGSRRELRFKQMAAEFYVKRPATVKKRNVLLVDDVITTGASICSATTALRRAGAKSVNALVFAKRL